LQPSPQTPSAPSSETPPNVAKAPASEPTPASSTATNGVFASLYVATQPKYYSPETVRYFLQQAIQEGTPPDELENLYEEIRRTVNPQAAPYAELMGQTAEQPTKGFEPPTAMGSFSEQAMKPKTRG
jgi:hypothetical protein